MRVLQVVVVVVVVVVVAVLQSYSSLVSGGSSDRLVWSDLVCRRVLCLVVLWCLASHRRSVAVFLALAYVHEQNDQQILTDFTLRL